MTSDAEIITLAVVQALLGYTSETRWIRRLRTDTALRRGSRVDDDTVWLGDSTPIECARSRPTVMRSALAGWAEYG